MRMMIRVWEANGQGPARQERRGLPNASCRQTAQATHSWASCNVGQRSGERTRKQQMRRVRRAAKEARRRAVLVLFSGPAGRPDGFEAKCAEESVRCVMIDTCHGGESHNLLRDQVFEDLMQRCREGEFAIVIIAVPCNTFSVARMRPGGPVVMRTRGKCRGVGGLSQGDFDRLLEANKLVSRSVMIGRAVGSFIFEHPPDRGEMGSDLFQTKFADHAPIWLMDEIRTLRRDAGASMVTFAQCALGGEYQKWTSLMCSPDVWPALECLQARVCTHGYELHSKQASGVDAQGVFKSRAAAAYPSEMVAALARAATGVAAKGAWQRFEGTSLGCVAQPLHIGSARPHAADGDAAVQRHGGDPGQFSLRRLEAERTEALMAEPFPTVNEPPVRSWAEPPKAEPNVPRPITTAQLMPKGVVSRLRAFRRKVGKCFAAALQGRWKWARDHRPAAIVLTEEEALLPAARGWTWLWNSEDQLWHAATPSSYPSDLPGAELNIDRIVGDAIAGGFEDMEVISYIAHGYPGPSLERSAVLGPPHVGALREVEAFRKSAAKDRLRGWVQAGADLPWAWPCRSDPQNVVVQKGKPRMTTDKSMRLASWVKSYNEMLDLGTIAPIQYVRVSQLGRAAAIMLASEAEVRIWGYDLEAFFRKTAKQRLHWWMSSTCQWDGYGQDTRVQFGQREAPVLCGRQSCFVVWAIRRELDRLGQEYAPRDVKVLAFIATRAAQAKAGDHAHAWAVLYFLLMYVDDGGAVSFNDLISDKQGRPIMVAAKEGGFEQQRRAHLYGAATLGVIEYYGHRGSEGKCVWDVLAHDFLGVTLDLVMGAMYLTEAKRQHYAELCRDAGAGAELPNGCRKVDGEELNSLMHKLMHAASCTPLGRQHLYHIRGAVRGGSRLREGKVLSAQAQQELRWWCAHLTGPQGVPLASRLQWPGASEDGVLVVYGDASRELTNPRESGWGGWCVLGTTFFYIEGRWNEAEVKLLSINVLEAHTLDMLTGTMLDLADRRHKAGCADCAKPVTHVSEFTDNTATEHSSERGKPTEWRMHRIVQRRYEENRARGVFTHTDRITSVDNDVADGLSRGGSGCESALRMMASLGLDLCRVQVEPWRRSTEWMRESV